MKEIEGKERMQVHTVRALLRQSSRQQRVRYVPLRIRISSLGNKILNLTSCMKKTENTPSSSLTTLPVH
jgi:hypothetical protein